MCLASDLLMKIRIIALGEHNHMKKTLKITGKILLGILITLVAAIMLLLVVRLIGKSINGKTPDGGINESMLVDINGTQQWINIYGQDKDNPVLLYLHGGPGSATSHLDYAFTRKWSDVRWSHGISETAEKATTPQRQIRSPQTS